MKAVEFKRITNKIADARQERLRKAGDAGVKFAASIQQFIERTLVTFPSSFERAAFVNAIVGGIRKIPTTTVDNGGR